MRHILVHHCDPEEGQAYAAEINQKLREGYRLKSAGRNYSRFAKGASETASYVLAFDPSRPRGRGYGSDEPPVEGAVAVNKCKGLWLYPADRKPEREEVWERVALAERKAFCKSANEGLLCLLLQFCMAVFLLFLNIRYAVRWNVVEQEAEGIVELFSSPLAWLLVFLLVSAEFLILTKHICNLRASALHRQFLKASVEGGKPYLLPAELRGRNYRRNLLITTGDGVCLVIAFCALLLLLLFQL